MLRCDWLTSSRTECSDPRSSCGSALHGAARETAEVLRGTSSFTRPARPPPPARRQGVSGCQPCAPGSSACAPRPCTEPPVVALLPTTAIHPLYRKAMASLASGIAAALLLATGAQAAGGAIPLALGTAAALPAQRELQFPFFPMRAQRHPPAAIRARLDLRSDQGRCRCRY